MSDTLQTLITRRFPAPEFVTFFEVAGRAHGADRFADVVAFGIWPSRGLLVHGFEVKDHRSDWLRELKQPSKAEAVMQHCDRWWLVTRPDVARAEEIPEPWGWLEERKGKLFQRKNAPTLERPAHMTKTFAANLLRRVNDTHVPRAELADRIKQACASERAQVEREMDPAAPRLRRDLEDLQKRVAAFEGASGVKIETWEPAEDIGEAFAIAMRIRKLGTKEAIDSLTWPRERLAGAVKAFDEAIADLKRGSS